MKSNTKLRIGYFADGKWAHEAFVLLNNDESIEVKFICVRYDTQDTTLKTYAINNNIAYLKHENINSKEFLKIVESYNCDLFVSMSFNQIFRETIINIPRLKTINCHAGKLPFYRGRNILNWVLINDEREFGITVHYMDVGIDTGDIILQRSFPITDKDNYSTLLDVAYVECANILYDAVKLIQNGRQQRVVQTSIHPVGFYCGIRGVGDEVLDWNQTSREIFNFVRAICKPGPQAHTTLQSELIRINNVELVQDAVVYKGTPGQVVGMKEGKPIVKTKDTIIRINEYDYKGRIRIGERFR